MAIVLPLPKGDLPWVKRIILFGFSGRTWLNGLSERRLQPRQSKSGQRASPCCSLSYLTRPLISSCSLKLIFYKACVGSNLNSTYHKELNWRFGWSYFFKIFLSQPASGRE